MLLLLRVHCLLGLTLRVLVVMVVVVVMIGLLGLLQGLLLRVMVLPRLLVLLVMEVVLLAAVVAAAVQQLAIIKAEARSRAVQLLLPGCC